MYARRIEERNWRVSALKGWERQAKVRVEARVPQTYVFDVEHGEIESRNLAENCVDFNKTIEWLLTDEDHPTPQAVRKHPEQN